MENITFLPPVLRNIWKNDHHMVQKYVYMFILLHTTAIIKRDAKFALLLY